MTNQNLSQISERTLCEHKFNINVRETICSIFLSIFLQYDKFVIASSLDEHGAWILATDTQDNFDKVRKMVIILNVIYEM